MDSKISITCSIKRQEINFFMRCLWSEIESNLGKFGTMKFGSSANEWSTGLRYFVVFFSFEKIGRVDVYFYHHCENGLTRIELIDKNNNGFLASDMADIIEKLLAKYKNIVPTKCIVELKMYNTVKLSGSYLFDDLLIIPTDEQKNIKTLKPITKFTGEASTTENEQIFNIKSDYYRQYSMTKCYVIVEGVSKADIIANAVEIISKVSSLMSVLTTCKFIMPEFTGDSVRIQKVEDVDEGLAQLKQMYNHEKAGCYLVDTADPIDQNDFYINNKLSLPAYSSKLINELLKERPYLRDWHFDIIRAANAFNDAILMEDLPQRWSIYSTLACISSLEAILENKQPKRCSACHQMIYSINKSFKDIVEKYISDEYITKAFTDLYASRSKFIHEARRSYVSSICLTDQPPYFLAEKNIALVNNAYFHSRHYINYSDFTAYILRSWIKEKLCGTEKTR